MNFLKKFLIVFLLVGFPAHNCLHAAVSDYVKSLTAKDAAGIGIVTTAMIFASIGIYSDYTTKDNKRPLYACLTPYISLFGSCTFILAACDKYCLGNSWNIKQNIVRMSASHIVFSIWVFLFGNRDDWSSGVTIF